MRSEVAQRMLDKLADRPFYVKWWSAFKFTRWEVSAYVRHAYLGKPESIHALNDIVQSIKDDIEFGYDRMWIYEKIMNGAYGNDPIPEEKSSFTDYKKGDIWNQKGKKK